MLMSDNKTFYWEKVQKALKEYVEEVGTLELGANDEPTIITDSKDLLNVLNEPGVIY
jgi:hypothetical protein